MTVPTGSEAIRSADALAGVIVSLRLSPNVAVERMKELRDAYYPNCSLHSVLGVLRRLMQTRGVVWTEFQGSDAGKEVLAALEKAVADSSSWREPVMEDVVPIATSSMTIAVFLSEN